MEFENETRVMGQPIYLGILGRHEKITKQQIYDEVIHPIISVLGRLPERVNVPSEGTLSAYINIWAERNHIDLCCVEADWRQFKRRAAILRDARILKDSTHLIIFNGVKSKSYESLAVREAKKGKHVYVIDPHTFDITEIVVE